MRAEWGEQAVWKIGIEMQIFAQLGESHELGVHVGAAETKWRLAPIIDRKRRQNFATQNISGLIVVDHFDHLQLPRIYLRQVNRALRDVIGDDVVVPVLLQNLDVVEDRVA
jgi:hypothetical protein